MDEDLVITSSTRFQLALLEAGIFDQAREIALSDPRLAIYWNTSINVMSNAPWVSDLASEMGLAESEMRNLIARSIED